MPPLIYLEQSDSEFTVVHSSLQLRAKQATQLSFDSLSMDWECTDGIGRAQRGTSFGNVVHAYE